MVSPFPPQPDGIGSYAVQSVRALRSEGHDVEVLSPGPSAAHHHLALKSPRGSLALAKRVRAYDRVIVQFHPDLFYRLPLTDVSIALDSVALAVMTAVARDIEFVVHEVDYQWGQRDGMAGRASRWLWQSVDRISVHTDTERDDLVRGFGVDPGRVRVIPHGEDFQPLTTCTRSEARASLGLSVDAFCFLCIGFVQPHKGFDRAVRAFASIGGDGARLDVVGGVRVEHPEYVAYVRDLGRLVYETPGAHLHAGFTSDELFDRWIVASDVLVLPYRRIWSSGVLERAALYSRAVIVTDVGGLREQAAGRVEITIVADDTELAQAMRRAAGLVDDEVVAEPFSVAGGVDRATVQADVDRRAARRRPRQVTAVESSSASRTALRDLPYAQLPHPAEGRPGTRTLRQLVQRLTAWQLRPIIDNLNRLHEAAAEEAEAERAPRSS